MTALAELAATLERAATTRGRNERVRLIGDFLRRLGAEELRPAVHLMLGRGAGTKSGVSWAALHAAARAAFGDGAIELGDEYVDAGAAVRQLAQRAGHRPEGRLTIREASEAFAAIGAARGRKEKERRLTELLRMAWPDEAAWLGRNAVGEMRSGAQEGLILEAVAHAAGAAPETIRRALIAAGDVAAVAEAALIDGGRGLAALEMQVGRPIPPMLADSASDLGAAFARMGGRLALEWKLDGARVQIHKRGEQVWLWSRRMTEVTERLPDVAAQVRRALATDEVIVEGELIVFGADGRPIAFQDVMRRWLRRSEPAAERSSAAPARPASIYLFDCLLADGRTLIDEPYRERWNALERVRGTLPTVERRLFEEGADPATAGDEAPPTAWAFYEAAVAAGHEGVMAKALDAPYAPGRRGAHWLKVKAESSLDLVVIGADWGTGRRHRWLSNYHLACRDPATGRFLSVGETFKGLTDQELGWMTEQLLARKVEQRGGYVAVRPEIVVEVLFNGVQRSTRLPSGAALRFARITRIREDKRPEEADTLETVRERLEHQGAPSELRGTDRASRVGRGEKVAPGEEQ